VSPRVEVADGV